MKKRLFNISVYVVLFFGLSLSANSLKDLQKVYERDGLYYKVFSNKLYNGKGFQENILFLIISNYKNGKKEGLSEVYTKNGELASTQMFKNNKKISQKDYFKIPTDSIIEENTDEKKVDTNSNVFYTATVKDLILNITNSKGREKLMKLSFSLRSTEPTISELIAQNKVKVVETVIQQVNARVSEELLTVGGEELLKEDLIKEINIVIDDLIATNKKIKRDSIKKLHFTTFKIR